MKSLQECPIVFQQEVAWGDMDAFGHVNNVMYYKYVESARIHYLNHLGMFETDLICVIASSNCRYLAPVEYPDTLKIGVTIGELRNSGFRMDYYVYSTQQKQMVAVSEAVVVMMEQGAKKKAAVPQTLRDKIIDIEKRVGNDLTVPVSAMPPARELLSDLGKTLTENIKGNIKEGLEQILPKLNK